ncbi:MAG: hypothetical protein J0I12_15600 [Candidatus Eremiobacteraeota bacterium]|nr:hypothetical protein [Candidatus Eremiobacteraeota bacterium]
MQITRLGQRSAPLPQRPTQTPNSLPRDVVLIGELRQSERMITRNTLLALTGSALVCTTALLASGQQSGLMAGLIGVPLGLVLGMGVSRWLNSDVREHQRQIEEQLRR